MYFDGLTGLGRNVGLPDAFQLKTKLLPFNHHDPGALPRLT
jgi:hypothetical protein